MTDGPDLVDVAGAIVEKALDSSPVQNLLGPLTTNLGLMLGDITDVARFYLGENLGKVFTKWDKQRDGKPLEPEEFRRVIPLLQSAAMQSNDELQERWAALLEKTASGDEKILPSFGQTLSQISAEEARFLDRIWELVTRPRDYVSSQPMGRTAMSSHNLLDLYAPNLRALSPAEVNFANIRQEQLSSEQLAGIQKMQQFELILHEFERLGLIMRQTELVQPTHYLVGDQTVSFGHQHLEESYALTQYAVNFVDAVKPKQHKP